MAKSIFIKKGSNIVTRSIYVYLDKDDLDKAPDMRLEKDEKRQPDEVVKVKIQKAPWGVVKKIQSVTTSHTLLGSVVVNSEETVEQVCKYCLKEIEGVEELQFDYDDEGYEKISDDCWLELNHGDEFISPSFFWVIYKAAKDINGVVL